MDFLTISTRETKTGIEVYPDFLVGRFKDLMVRSGSVYAIWDDELGLWSTDEYDVQRLVDEELRKYADKLDGIVKVKYLRNGSNKTWSNFKAHVKTLSDNSVQLDESLTFADQKVKRTDYVSRRLSYSLYAGDHSAWDELVSTLYEPEQREKVEWMIGSIVSGDSKKIQKFFVFYGDPGTGKSTIMSIVEQLFEGYTTSFDAKSLGVSNNQFATEAFRHNPLVAIQHDGDLSKVEDNTKLNSIIAHEPMLMNEKFKATYTSSVNAILLMGTNSEVKINDSKSGLLRRLIDIHPSGKRLSRNHYDTLLTKISFQLGAVAQHCLDVYRKRGKNYYANYRPTEMMLQSNPFFNFIEWHYDIFKSQDGTTLRQAYTLYKEYCAETGVDRTMPQHRFREELRSYFDHFHERGMLDGVSVRNFYSGFNAEKYKAPSDSKNNKAFSLVMEETLSLFDQEYAEYPAQLASASGTPKSSWSLVRTTLAEVDTSEVHYVKVPDEHIVIDFDLKDENGEKSLERNLEEASKWPSTYAEISKSGNGVHLHYNYVGDVNELARDFSEGIEVKVFSGNSALRRRLSKCNNVPIAQMVNTLPIKEKKPKMLGADTVKSEKALRDLITRNLNKDIHSGTKPSIDFIKTILNEAYESDLVYDLSDMRPKIVVFANNSSNHALYCLKAIKEMQFKSKPTVQDLADIQAAAMDNTNGRRVFYDVEVYPNLFVLCWKYEGAEDVVRMINPDAAAIETVMAMKLIGFNNRRYDNHIIYARYMGYDNQALYELSQKIINKSVGAMFGEAYNLSYADIYDFSSKKQSLKKFMIDLKINKIEMDIPWDQPVPEDKIQLVVDYCANDVEGTEATFKDREQDFVARQILAALSGLTVNDPTPKHTAKIIFGGDRDARKSFIYTDLSTEFPGYTFDLGKSSYRGENPGEGGYVYAEPGMYQNVAVLDVASMHPTSIKQLNAFGEYTPNFVALLDARVAIKRGQFDDARGMLGGKLAPFLTDEKQAKALAYALKIVINIVYGLTAAKFDNPFRIPKNVDNIVAKRGALFMIDLKKAVQEQFNAVGEPYNVVHIKTDSIKIPDADPYIIDFVTNFGAKYGYEFEHEATYDQFCLVNDAVYVARLGKGEHAHYEAVGAQFQHPYVYKTLFTEEEITFDDLCETKQVQKGTIYIDYNNVDKPDMENLSKMQFIGRIGRFVPVKVESKLGGTIWRVSEDGKFYAVSGTKGYRWVDAKMAEQFGGFDDIDMDFFEQLTNEARDKIEREGSYASFCND
jgi:hypothetical protein